LPASESVGGYSQNKPTQTPAHPIQHFIQVGNLGSAVDLAVLCILDAWWLLETIPEANTGHMSADSIPNDVGVLLRLSTSLSQSLDSV
jgi:hypothetical protein